ncbi:MAG: Uncharacterized protein YmdB, partial [uncultured Thermomicrobiales bacterium]
DRRRDRLRGGSDAVACPRRRRRDRGAGAKRPAAHPAAVARRTRRGFGHRQRREQRRGTRHLAQDGDRTARRRGGRDHDRQPRLVPTRHRASPGRRRPPRRPPAQLSRRAAGTSVGDVDRARSPDNRGQPDGTGLHDRARRSVPGDGRLSARWGGGNGPAPARCRRLPRRGDVREGGHGLAPGRSRGGGCRHAHPRADRGRPCAAGGDRVRDRSRDGRPGRLDHRRPGGASAAPVPHPATRALRGRRRPGHLQRRAARTRRRARHLPRRAPHRSVGHERAAGSSGAFTRGFPRM